MKLNLTQKLVFVIEIAVFITALSGGYATFLSLRKTLVARVNAQIESVSVLKEHSVLGFIKEVRSEIEYLVGSDKANPDLVKFLVSRTSEDYKKVDAQILDMFTEKPIFSSVFVMSESGEILLSTDRQDEGKIKLSEPYFSSSQKETTIQEFYYDTSLGIPTLIITSPARDEKSNFLGMVVGRVNIQEISDLMVKRSGLGVTGETFLVNSSNMVVTELLKESNSSLKRVLFLPQVEKCLAGQSNFEEALDYHHDLVLGYWRWFPEIRSCLVTKIDLVEALSPVREATKTLLMIVGGLGIIVGVIGYFMGRYLLGPLKKLRDEVNNFREGNFSDFKVIISNDEIGELAGSFGNMAEKLKKSYSELEEKVKQKTEELSQNLLALKKKNDEQQESQVAMLNVLEDGKALELALAEEKKNVEVKVVERTNELSREKSVLRSSIASLPQAFVIIDKDLNVIIQNGKLEEIFGETMDNWSLEAIDKLLGNNFALVQKMKEVLEKKEATLVNEFESGVKFLRAYLAPVIGFDDELIGGILMIQDVTEEKVVNRSKDEFFSIASHELRTPLTAIRGNAEMIIDNYGDKITNKDVKEMLADIHEGSVRLIEIVNDFLNLSRLEMNKLEFKIEDFDIEEVVQKTIKEFQVSGSRQKLHLELEESGVRLPKVKGDVDRVKQVLINLIGNGFKFTEVGGVTLSIKEVKNMVEVSVKDTGAGIALEQQGLLFHKFQQAGSSLYTRDTSKGTGLGLYISKLIMEGMGGKIWLAYSEPSKGSVFTFSLPKA